MYNLIYKYCMVNFSIINILLQWKMIATTSQCKTSADNFIDYCGTMQNFEEQCEGIYTADIYLKIYMY